MSERYETVVPFTGANFPTWKMQCKMTLVKEGLWGVVNGSDTLAESSTAEDKSKLQKRKDRALALIVLSIDPSLLYLIGEPKDPVAVWTILSDQFQKKTWANRLALRCQLHSTRLSEGQSVNAHVKAMTELFTELAVIGDSIDDDDRVIYLLASLPESFNVLVTALEASSEVPKMESMIERLLHEAQKQNDRSSASAGGLTKREPALTVKHRRKGPQCHYCKRFGHIQRN